MQSILEIALINAIVVVPLAILVFFVGRLLRRPALAHVLWVVVLIKLMTPPVWQIPLIDRDSFVSSIHQILPPVLTDVDRLVEISAFDELKRSDQYDDGRGLDPQSMITFDPSARPRTLAEQNKKSTVRPNSLMSSIHSWIRNGVFRDLLIAGLMAVWGIGGLIWFGFQGYRCVRFRWLLTSGARAPDELQAFSDQFARRLGLSRSPTVWLMPGVMSPMLWGNGHSKLLIFPEMLLDRLDRDSAGTLLIHELAHFRRRDHWVRVIELMATGFFWWHPVVWWSRREIEAVEEECCDALVVQVGTTPPKRYAEAILEAVDFLGEIQVRLPALATGLSQFPFLRQRLTWIMRGPRRQDLGYCGRVLFLLLACHLPLQPTWLAARTPKPTVNEELSEPHPWIEMRPRPESSIRDSEAGIAAISHSATIGASTEESAVPSRWMGLDVRSHSFDKRFIILANKSTQILLDLETGRDFDLSPFDITAIAFSPNTNQFATIDGGRFLRLWDAENCDVIQTWQVPSGKSKTVDISLDARWIVTGGGDGVIRIWSATSQRPFRELPRELAPVNCVRFSPDSHLLAIATGDEMSPQTGRIALFDVGSWTERISMNWNSPAAAIAFRADGQSLTSGDWQGRIARWKIETGELMGLANVQAHMLVADEFSPNGSPLVDVEIPDLNPNAHWGDSVNRDQTPWFFQGWPMMQPASPKKSPEPMR